MSPAIVRIGFMGAGKSTALAAARRAGLETAEVDALMEAELALLDAQKKAFLQLISEYGDLANDEDAASRMTTLEADLDDTYFAWYGATSQSGPAYFRVTGPHVVIEYSPQSMGGDAAAHIHGIYRDPTNDYGAAITK